MKMRKLVYVACGLALVLGVSGCVNDKKDEGSGTTMAAQTSTPKDTKKEVTAKEVTDEEATGEDITLDISTENLGYGELEAFKNIYDQIQPVEDADNYVATWSRTNVGTGASAQIIITNQDAEGFDFTGEFFSYSHLGCLEGRAYFVTRNLAIFEYNQEGYEAPAQYVVFEMTGDGMKVIASGESGDLGFGMSVFADGTYVTGDPVYTNATILDDNFTPEEQEGIKSLLGDKYEEYFKDVVEFGILESTECILEDETSAVFYEGFIPTMGGYRFELLKCENGDLYFYSESEEVGWKTNVSGAIDYPAYENREN